MEGPSSHMQASGLLKRQQRWLSADRVSPAAPQGLISIYANDPVAPPTTQPPLPRHLQARFGLLCVKFYEVGIYGRLVLWN